MTATTMFQVRDANLGEIGSPRWNREVFEIAYCKESAPGKYGPFERVQARLRDHFSILVYLPGNCMRAAADVVQNWFASGIKIFGSDMGKGHTIGETYRQMGSLMESIIQWISGGAGRPGRTVWMNLDILLGNERSSMLGTLEARTGLFALAECIRNGAALGLSDVGAGRLPPEVEHLFDEVLIMDEIEMERFWGLMPDSFNKPQLSITPHSGPGWVIASRLRWVDPLRAVRIMDRAAGKGSVEEVLSEIKKATLSVEYTDPGVPIEEEIGGYTGQTLSAVKNIIEAFKAWNKFKGNEKQYQARLAGLPAGLILEGPPGTGKTRLARWVARSTGLPYRIVGGADVRARWFGDPERNVRELFRGARKAAPCILVLDDADDLLCSREKLAGSSLAGAERAIVNAFLEQLEGFEGRIPGVLVILTTNRFKDLEGAITQRLGQKVRVPYPLDDGQVWEILGIQARELGFRLEDPVLAALVKLFRKLPKTDTTLNPDLPASCYAATSGMFAPRDIARVLLRLRDGSWEDGDKIDNEGNYIPTLADVERIGRELEGTEGAV